MNNPILWLTIFLCCLSSCLRPKKDIHAVAKKLIDSTSQELSAEFFPSYDRRVENGFIYEYTWQKSLSLLEDSIIIEKWVYNHEIRMYIIKFFDGDKTVLPFPAHDFVSYWQYGQLVDSNQVAEKTFAYYYYELNKKVSKKFTPRKAEMILPEIMVSLENARTINDSADIVEGWSYTSSTLYDKTSDDVCEQKKKNISHQVLKNIFIKDYFIIRNAFLNRGIIVQIPYLDNNNLNKGTRIIVYRTECFLPEIKPISSY